MRLREFLLSKDREAIKNVVSSVLVDPNKVPQMDLFLVVYHLFETIGNKEQSAFWYYIAQLRTRACAKADPDESATRAICSSFLNDLGQPVNEWVARDINAWKSLTERAIAYEKKLGNPKRPDYVINDTEWKTLVDKERIEYEADFKKTFRTEILNKQAKFETTRTKNGLYVGPWKERWNPLLDSWK